VAANHWSNNVCVKASWARTEGKRQIHAQTEDWLKSLALKDGVEQKMNLLSLAFHRAVRRSEQKLGRQKEGLQPCVHELMSTRAKSPRTRPRAGTAIDEHPNRKMDTSIRTAARNDIRVHGPWAGKGMNFPLVSSRTTSLKEN
jgi:hypothetical protein